ncbi:ABC transporter ATP-binding protein [Asticcacaulis sp.]|uniref:ABC transporter ATP-binding protein n=1 Tax=Asticcacaulis sp. TaxID=1872648 RepID=UPI002BF7556F|nr:ABC transporter ATP-binding protein [Asticcacaulis sp.]HTM82205.1 ABC transporter ATP-binding protein [Asticcacaulis sp.]
MISQRLGARSLVCLCLSLELFGVGLGTVGPLLLKRLIDTASSPHFVGEGLALDIAAFVIAWTGTSFIGSLRSIYSTRINGRLAEHLISRAIRGRLVDDRPGDQDSGKLLGDLERLGYSLMVVIDGCIWRIAPLLIQFVLSLAVIVRLMSWRYLIILALLAVGFVAISWLGGRRINEAAKGFVIASGTNAGLIGDVLRNMERVVCNGAIDYEVNAVEVALSDRTRAATCMGWSLVGLSGMQYAMVASGMFLLLLLAAIDLNRGAITTGDFVLLQAYGLNLVLPMAAVGFIISQSAAAIANISEVMSVTVVTEVPDRPTAPSMCRRASSVEVSDVSFSYALGGPVIDKVSAEFPHASFSAIVGRNGSGKSTLSKLIAGRLAPESGLITHNGLPLSEVPPVWRHRSVLYVPQRPGVLNRSLRANLTYPPAVQAAACAVDRLKRWDFFESGQVIDLDQPVGEAGAKLSGGQLQKMELARVAGIDVPCLILDESTSAMDPASEQKALADLRAIRGTATTIIVVTHRLSVVQDADQVLWMVDGRLAGVGGHDELLRFAAYRALWAGDDPDGHEAAQEVD